VIGALVILFDLVQPAYDSVSQLKGEVAGQQAYLETEKQAVQKAQDLITQYQSQSQSAQNVGLSLPSSQDMAGALAQIYGLAQNNNLVIQIAAVSAPTLLVTQTKGATNAGGAAAATAKGSDGISKPIGTYTLQLTANGSYESVRGFIAGLESNIRIFDVKGFLVGQSQGAGGAHAANQNFFTYTITVATYYQT
jgi:septal ring-binding cell division protein DamX